MSGSPSNAGRLYCRVRSFVLVSLCVFALAAAVATCAAKKLPAHPIDLNTATAAQLEQLPGIGPARASAIVAFREKSGPFRRVEDLLVVRGIAKQQVEKIRPYVKITPPRSKSGNSH